MTPPLHAPQHSRIINPQQYQGEECMAGHVRWRHGMKGRPWCYVRFPYDGKIWEVTRYKGRRMYDERDAWKLIHQMQGEVEDGSFNPLKYTRGETNAITFLYEWLEECAGNWTPGTRRLYKSYVVNHIEPFFKLRPYQLNEVKKKAYQELKTYLEKKTKDVPGPDGKKIKVPAMQPEFVKKVVDCLRAAMFYAFDCEIVGSPPPRIKRESYQIPEREIQATTEELQLKVIKEIEPRLQPIYWFCKYHPKVRPANAMVIRIEDYDPVTDTFTIRRGISDNQEVEFTKTKRVHKQPCHPDFRPIMKEILEENRAEKVLYNKAYPWSPYIFTCKESRQKGKRYTKEVFNSRWNKAAEKVGVKIDLYHGTRHTTLTKYANDDKLTPEQLRLLAGHSSVATTMKYYTNVSIETERALLAGKVVEIDKKKSAPNLPPKLEKKK